MAFDVRGDSLVGGTGGAVATDRFDATPGPFSAGAFARLVALDALVARFASDVVFSAGVVLVALEIFAVGVFAVDEDDVDVLAVDVLAVDFFTVAGVFDAVAFFDDPSARVRFVATVSFAAVFFTTLFFAALFVAAFFFAALFFAALFVAAVSFVALSFAAFVFVEESVAADFFAPGETLVDFDLDFDAAFTDGFVSVVVRVFLAAPELRSAVNDVGMAVLPLLPVLRRRPHPR